VLDLTAAPALFGEPVVCLLRVLPTACLIDSQSTLQYLQGRLCQLQAPSRCSRYSRLLLRSLRTDNSWSFFLVDLDCKHSVFGAALLLVMTCLVWGSADPFHFVAFDDIINCDAAIHCATAPTVLAATNPKTIKQ